MIYDPSYSLLMINFSFTIRVTDKLFGSHSGSVPPLATASKLDNFSMETMDPGVEDRVAVLANILIIVQLIL